MELIVNILTNFDRLYEMSVGIMMMAVFGVYLVEDMLEIGPKRSGIEFLKEPAVKGTLKWFGIMVIVSNIAWVMPHVLYEISPKDENVALYGLSKLGINLFLCILLVPYLLWSINFVLNRPKYHSGLN